MEIKDFLPKYPNISKFSNNIMNPYEDNFYQSIYRKREFYELKLPDPSQEKPPVPGIPMKHQKMLARFMSSNTPYDGVLVVGEMGSGKTCAGVTAIEQIRQDPNSNIDGAIIFARGPGLLDNWVNEIKNKCTPGIYVPKNYNKINQKDMISNTKKVASDFYKFNLGKIKPTFQVFAKYVKNASSKELKERFSNKIIILDEVHNLREKTTEGSIYNQFNKFLHSVDNCKIILLSGTPMKDLPQEISSIMNLILPEKDQFPSIGKFTKEYLDMKGPELYEIKPEKIPELKQRFKGRVSFLKSVRTKVKKVFVGEILQPLKYFNVSPTTMSEFQTKSYNIALSNDSRNKNDDNKEPEEEEGKKGVYSSSIQASLFVFPDGTYGSTGFKKYILRKKKGVFSLKKKKKVIFSHSMSPELKKLLLAGANENNARKPEKYPEDANRILKNISMYSSKYAEIINIIIKSPKQNIFLYSDLVSGSGSILFSELLKLFGYYNSNGSETRHGKRYAILTSTTTSKEDINKMSNRFNQPDNIYGEYIQIIIGSAVISEGFSFYNIQKEFIITPWYNYANTDQAIARGYRLGSHQGLIDKGGNPTMEVYQCVSLPNKLLKNLRSYKSSVDLYKYKKSEDKDISIKRMMRILMVSAYDCALNYLRNHISGYDGLRECEYGDCDYICDGFESMDFIEQDLPDEFIDDSTYQLYYIKTKLPVLKRKIVNLLEEESDITFEYILGKFEDEHSEWEIRFALSDLLGRLNNVLNGEIVNLESVKIDVSTTGK